jgi:hypothetical protein
MSWLADCLAMTPIGRRRRLTRAAGIGTAVLACHPETWDEIQSLAGALEPRRPVNGTLRPEGDGGLAEVSLSGVALTALMQAMYEVMAAPGHRFPPHDRATARRIYLAAARVVRQVTSDPAASRPRIVLDDRMPS